ncbi:MAG: YHYH protein [Cyanobacteria bacterium J06621_11]
MTAVCLLSACGEDLVEDPVSELPTQPAGQPSIETDPTELFLEDGLIKDITEESCTLSGGTETTCYRITVASVPIDHEAGPWCPGTITDTAETGGIWVESGDVYDVDGPFVEGLDTFYDDSNWKLYEEDGTIRVTGTKEQCAAAARPDVDEAYQNYCVQCLSSYVEDGKAISTYVIPTTPVEQSSSTQPNRVTAVGVALNGVRFDPPAPTDAILGAYTIAPFDDCGGHINLNEGYHYHAHTGCSTEIEQADSHAPMIGYAIDGFPMYALLDKAGEIPDGLDECRGEYDEIRGYHYHVGEPGSNLFINCFKGETGCKFEGEGEDQVCDATKVDDRRGGPQGGGGPGGPGSGNGGGNGDVPPGFPEAAEALGVPIDELMDALGSPPFDLDAAANTLGVTVEELQEVLPPPPQRQPGPPPS